MEVGVGDSAYVPEEFRACFVHDGEDYLYFGQICAVAGDSWVAAVKDAVRVTEGEAEVTGLKEACRRAHMVSSVSYILELRETFEKHWRV